MGGGCASWLELRQAADGDPVAFPSNGCLHLGLTVGDLARYLEAPPFVFSVFTHDDVWRAAEAANPVTPTRRQTKYE